MGVDLILEMSLIALALICMIYIALVDWKTYEIPMLAVVSVFIIGLAYRWYIQEDLISGILLALGVTLAIYLVTILMQKILKKPILGYGDLQVLVASIVWLDISQLPLFLVTIGLAGVVISFFFVKEKYFPFAPAIVIGWLIVILYK